MSDRTAELRTLMRLTEQSATGAGLVLNAPDYDAALRIAEDAAQAARRTNVRVRDGRINNALVSEIRSDDDPDESGSLL